MPQLRTEAQLCSGNIKAELSYSHGDTRDKMHLLFLICSSFSRLKTKSGASWHYLSVGKGLGWGREIKVKTTGKALEI
jgi:hypothetical protein